LLAVAGISIVAILLATVALGFVLSRPEANAKVQQFDVAIGEIKLLEEVEGKDVLGPEGHTIEPPVLVVHKGDHVIIRVMNLRKNTHSLVLPDFGVDTGVLAPRKGIATVEFDADKAGVFQFSCGIPYDEDIGACDPDHDFIKGWLVVLE
jgi:plastocyanin domain-containing protein